MNSTFLICMEAHNNDAIILFMCASSVRQPHPKVLFWHLYNPTHGYIAALGAVSTAVNNIITKLSASPVQRLYGQPINVT